MVEMVAIHLSTDDAGGDSNIHSTDFDFAHINTEHAIGIEGGSNFEGNNKSCAIDAGDGCDDNSIRSEIDGW